MLSSLSTNRNLSEAHPPNTDIGAQHVVGPSAAGQCRDRPPKRYKVKQDSSNFMNNTENARKCLEWINRAIIKIETQEEIDNIYSSLQLLIIDEMNMFYKPISGLKCTKKAAKHRQKEWWCEELSACWKELKECEKQYRKIPRSSKDTGHIRH